jgi:hypothetical protein
MKREGVVSGAGWRCIKTAAGLLAPLEREVVLGDLAEADRGALRGLIDVLGLAARRQIAFWTSWRPWAASLGLALPASLYLMFWSVAAGDAAGSLVGEPSNLRLLWLCLSRLLLLSCWSWTTGYTVSAVSRRTLWASLLACCVPCLDCLSKWPGHGLSGLELLIFLIPGLGGAWCGRQQLRLGLSCAIFLMAIAMLAPIMAGTGGWMYGCWLLWPGGYLLTKAIRPPALLSKSH